MRIFTKGIPCACPILGGMVEQSSSSRSSSSSSSASTHPLAFLKRRCSSRWMDGSQPTANRKQGTSSGREDAHSQNSYYTIYLDARETPLQKQQQQQQKGSSSGRSSRSRGIVRVLCCAKDGDEV